MRAVGIKHLATDQPPCHGLFHDVIEDALRDVGAIEPPPAVLAEGRGVEHPFRQPQPDEPAIGHIDLDLAHQLPLGPDAEQIADKQRLEELLRRDRRAAVIRAIQVFGHLPDEPEVNRSIDPAQQMIARNQLLQGHHLKLGLLW
jgi:hypothetical protein